MHPNDIRMQEVDQVKNNLAKSANLRNLSMEDLETQQHLVNGIKKVSEAEIIKQAQQIENVILPAILKKSGDGEDYRFWKGVLDTMNWSLFLIDYSIRLEGRMIRQRHENLYLKNLAAKLEMELNQYTTMERFMTGEIIKEYFKNIQP